MIGTVTDRLRHRVDVLTDQRDEARRQANRWRRAASDARRSRDLWRQRLRNLR